jgi:hypothetical protein
MLDIPQPPGNFGEQEEMDWKRSLLTAAMCRMQQRVTAENFAIYSALLEERATLEELSRQFGKEPNAIYAVKHRCEKMLLAEARVIRQAWEQLQQDGLKQRA